MIVRSGGVATFHPPYFALMICFGFTLCAMRSALCNFLTSGINQCLGKLTDLHTFGISLAQIAGEGPLSFLIKKHGIKRTGADTGFTAIAQIRIHLNGTGYRLS